MKKAQLQINKTGYRERQFDPTNAEEIMKQFIENKRLYDLYEQDKADFTKSATKHWGHLLPPGINANEWFGERLRSDCDQPYFIEPRAEHTPLTEPDDTREYYTAPKNADGHGQIVLCYANDAIKEFIDENNISPKCIRAHENVHKMTHFKLPGENAYRVGFRINDGDINQGRGFNEGATNIMAKRLTDFEPDTLGYHFETQIANKVMNIADEDTFFGAMLLDPQILTEKYDDIAGKGRYIKLIYDTDNLFNLRKNLYSSTTNRGYGKSQTDIYTSYKQIAHDLKRVEQKIKPYPKLRNSTITGTSPKETPMTL